MKAKLLKKIFLFSFICLAGVLQTNAQADIEYTFDGTTFEGWMRQAGTGAFVSAFANSNPNDALNVSWPDVGANTRNVVMYGPAAVATMNADDRKFIQIILSNTSSEIAILRLRGRVAGGGFSNFIDVPIVQDAAGTFSTYDIDLTGVAAYAGALDRFQIVFRAAGNAVLTANTNTDAILVDNILVSAMQTLSTNDFQSFNFEMFPNPVKNSLNITTPETIQKVEVLDLLGRSVLTVNDVNSSIDVSTLKSAVYIVKLTSNKGSATKKFIKE